MRWKISLMIQTLMFFYTIGYAQEQGLVFKSLRMLYDNINILHGNIYFNNVYPNESDTSYFNDESLQESLLVIKSERMKRVALNFDSLLNYIPSDRIKNEYEFAKIPNIANGVTEQEYEYTVRVDSVLWVLDPKISDNASRMASEKAIENLLLTSANRQVVQQKMVKAEKKLLTILGVYENDRIQIIFYMVYMSLTNSYVASEIVLKKSFRDF